MQDVLVQIYRKHFKHQYTVPYGDTDSVVYTIQHPDIYEWTKDDSQYLDLSDYTRVYMHSNENKNNQVVLKMN